MSHGPLDVIAFHHNALHPLCRCSPHVQLSSYTKEHPNLSEILIRCQTNGVVSAEQGMVESLHLAKEVLMHVEVSTSIV